MAAHLIGRLVLSFWFLAAILNLSLNSCLRYVHMPSIHSQGSELWSSAMKIRNSVVFFLVWTNTMSEKEGNLTYRSCLIESSRVLSFVIIVKDWSLNGTFRFRSCGGYFCTCCLHNNVSTPSLVAGCTGEGLYA